MTFVIHTNHKVTAEYTTLENVDKYDRDQFEWMMEHGEIVLQCGNTVWQIRN